MYRSGFVVFVHVPAPQSKKAHIVIFKCFMNGVIIKWFVNLQEIRKRRKIKRMRLACLGQARVVVRQKAAEFFESSGKVALVGKTAGIGDLG